MPPPLDEGFSAALEALRGLGSGPQLTHRIAEIERRLQGIERDQAGRLVELDGIDSTVLDAALLMKSLAGQINVVVHAVGILVSLPHVLEPGEVIESLSLGAGNTGRAHDLETDRRIAEFKFIEWRGGAESIRQNTLFVDLFNLASAATEKRRVLYVVGKTMPMRFLNNRRALSSVLSKNRAVADRFRSLHGDRYTTVRAYYDSVRSMVDIVDLRDVVPAFRVPSSDVLS